MGKQLEDMDIIDNFLMNELAANAEVGEQACKEMLSTLLGKKLGRVRVMAQRNLTPGRPGYRGVIMDVEVDEDIDNDGNDNAPGMNIYDLEPHRKPKEKEDLPRRIRFYQAKIDHSKLKSGERSFARLPNLYIVFVLDYDPFGFDQVCYTIENACLEVPELEYNDGLTIKYFNTTGTVGGNPAVNNMLHFIQHSTLQNVVDDSTRKMYDYVTVVKGEEDTRMRYLTWEEYFADYFADDIEEAREQAREEAMKEGMAEGRKEGREEELLNIMCKKLAKGKELEEIANDLEKDVQDVQPIYEFIIKFAPDYNADTIFKEFIKEKTS